MRLIAATADHRGRQLALYGRLRCARVRPGHVGGACTTRSTSSAGTPRGSTAVGRARRLGEAGAQRPAARRGRPAESLEGPGHGDRSARAAVRSEGVDAHLLLIGSAKFVARATRFDNEAYVARLRALVADAGLQDRVSWLGEREDVPELVRALDVLLLPSWEEPFGRALIEAMALGVPVLATDVGRAGGDHRDGPRGLPARSARARGLGARHRPDRRESRRGAADGPRGARARRAGVHVRARGRPRPITSRCRRASAVARAEA